MNQTFPIRDWAGALVQCVQVVMGLNLIAGYWMDIFTHLFFCKNCIACSEKTKEVTENGQIKKGTIKHKTSPDSFEPALSGWHLMTLPLNYYISSEK